jgi:amidase
MIDRRGLFRVGATVAAGVVIDACSSKPEAPPSPPSPTPPPAAMTPDAAVGFPADDLVEASIADLAAKLASGAETTVSLVDKYRRRIAAMNEQGPALRAVLELDREADAKARALDAERAAGKLRGPLHGIPILVKDNIDVAGMMTSAGSAALDGLPTPRDAFVIARLREAGALVLGKTNLSEWANFRGTASSSGWSARGGQCRNPYALDRSPSGSSSGSGSAVAASLCGAALGSETDGSIVSPASVAGLVGVKPTVGLVSRTGVIPIAASQDTVGPLARTVRDAALLLAAIAGRDPDDAATGAAPARSADYLAALDPKALAGARLGVPRKGFFGANRGVDTVMTAVLARLAQLGAVLVDPAELEIPPELGPAELDVFIGEMAPLMAGYLKRRPTAAVKTLADVVAFNTAHADRELAYFGQEWFEKSVAAGGMTTKSYREARAKCIAIARVQLIDKVMAAHQLDAFVAATNGPAGLIDLVNGDGANVGCSTLPAVAGYPHVTVWGGDRFGLPVGLSFFGKPFTEGKLLGYAYAWEQATKLRVPPTYRATVALG